MELKTKRLNIIPATLDLLKKYEAKEYPIDENMPPHIAWSLSELKEDANFLGWGVWLVIEVKTDKVVGDIGFKGKPNELAVVEVGYGILPHAQNKGYATEAMEALCDWAFRTGQVKKILADCMRDNLPSIRVLEKLGMKQVGLNGDLLLWELVLAKTDLKMTIELRAITQANYMECLDLKVAKEQEDFVAPNMFSLAQAAYEPDTYVLAIYKADQMVGFILYRFNSQYLEWRMSRFMIDAAYQKQGIGKLALEKFVQLFYAKHGLLTLTTSASVDNLVAINLYESLGFKQGEVLEYESGGQMYRSVRMVLGSV